MIFLISAQCIYCNDMDDDIFNYQIITSEEIDKLGINRLTDIIKFIHNSYYYTLDGYCYYVSLNSHNLYQQQNLIIFLDGQRIDIDAFNQIDFNMIPISVDMIDYIEIIKSPIVYQGEFIEGGCIHIHTISDYSKYYIHSHRMYGNEIGDPGPYKYIYPEKPNIDGISQDASLSGGLRINSFKFSINTLTQQHTYTGLDIRNRIFSSCEDGWGNMDMKLYSGTFGYEDENIKIDFFSGYSFAERQFYFFKPFGNEIPINNYFFHLGNNSRIILSKNNHLNFKLKYSYKNLDYHNNTFNFNFNYKMENIHSLLEYQQYGKLFYNVGIGIDKYKLCTDYSLSKDNIYLFKFYGNFSSKINYKVTYSMGYLIRYFDQDLIFNVYLASRFDITNKQYLTIIFSYSQKPLMETNELIFWTNQGYDLLNKYNVTNYYPEKLNQSSSYFFDLSFKSNICDNLYLNFNSKLSYFKDYNYEVFKYTFDSANIFLSTPYTIIPSNKGGIINFSFLLRQDINEYLKHNFSLSFVESMFYSSYLEADVVKFPKYTLNYNIEFSPFNDLSCVATFQYLSTTEWVEFNKLNGESQTVGEYTKDYNYISNEIYLVNLNFTKWFFNHHLKFNIDCRNLLNRKIDYNPIGRSYSTVFLINIEYSFSD